MNDHKGWVSQATWKYSIPRSMIPGISLHARQTVQAGALLGEVDVPYWSDRLFWSLG